MVPRIPFDSMTLRAVADGLRRVLSGATVQQVSQPDALDLVLTMRTGGRNHALLVSCHPTFGRIHLTSARRPNPPEAPAFCMVGRKHLLGARLAKVKQRGFDRVLELAFEDAEGGTVRLIAELVGKHGNVVLVGGDGTVLDAAKRIGPRLNRFRTTLPGHAYVDPPAQADRVDPFSVGAAEVEAFWEQTPEDTEAAAARLMSHFEGLSPFLATELIQRARASSPAGAWDDLFGAARKGAWRPVLVRNERGETVGAYPFETVQAPPDSQHARDSLLSALDAHYTAAIPRAERDAALHELESHLKKAIVSRERRIQDLRRALAESDRAGTLRQHADLLMAHAHEVPDGADQVTLADEYNPGAPDIALKLDPLLSARENAEAIYRRCRKLQDGAVHRGSELARAEDEVVELSAALARLPDMRDAAAIRGTRRELTEAGLLRPENSGGAVDHTGKRVEPDFEGHKIKRVHTPEGFEILIGETATANDYLTRRIAEPDDYWFHVRQNTGSHVVIRTRRKPATVPPSVIREAARLAAAHSSAKHSSMVPVDYTLKKHVRRPRNAAPGQALYQHEKTIHVETA